MGKWLLTVCFASLLFTACAWQPVKKPQTVTPAPPPSNTVQLQDNKALSYAKNFDGQVGLYAKNLKTAQEIQWNASEIFGTASTHKLVVALAIYKYVYQDVAAEQKKEYDRQIQKMMEISDNPSFYELLDEIEKRKPAALTQVLSDLKLTKTRIHSKEAFQQYGYHSITTPQEMGLVFETIYNSNYLPPDTAAILKDELSRTIFKDEIPRYMQGKVMHKVGQLPDGTLNDVGVIDDGKNQILISVFTKTKHSPEYASSFIAKLSEKTYGELREKQPSPQPSQ